jgi:Secretion system C-terminal sorting domain
LGLKNYFFVFQSHSPSGEGLENLSYDTDNARKTTEKQLYLKLLGSKNDNLALELHQNRPNPFVNETTISFILPDDNTTELSIYDVNGRKVYTLNRTFNKGYNEVTINNTVLKNSGIYFYRLQSDKFTAIKRMQYLADKKLKMAL